MLTECVRDSASYRGEEVRLGDMVLCYSEFILVN